MLDGVYSGFHAVAESPASVGVSSHAEPDPVGLVHASLDLVAGEVRHGGRVAEVLPGRVDLDEVGAPFHVVPDRLPEVLDAVEAEGVLPPAVGRPDAAHAGEDTGSGNEALLHRVADRGRPERSLARVPDSGDPGPDVRSEVGDALEHLIEFRLRVPLLEVLAEAQHEVGVTVDQAGQDGGTAEVDDRG